MTNAGRTFFLTLMALLMLMAPVRAQYEDSLANPEDLNFIGNGIIKEILRTDMIMLDSDRRYRLDNILVPPYEDKPALDELKRAFLDKKVSIYESHDLEDNPDRYGLPLVHIVTDDNIWVQQDLVSKGLAWAYCPELSSQMVSVLKQMEESARAQKLGFWKNPVYEVKNVNNVQDFINTYQIVEGKILRVYSNVHATYFNFGKNWKTDFTVRVPATFTRWYTNKNDIDPQNWTGRTVRVRGWVIGQDGPMIVLTNKEQIDVLSGSK